MTRLSDIGRTAFIWASTGEEPSLQFDACTGIVTFCFRNVGDATAALVAYEVGGTIEAKILLRLRDTLFRRIRGAK